MSRDYQAQKNNEHWIPHNQYMQTLYFIRSYYDIVEKHDAIIQEGKSVSDMDGMPHGSNTSDETADKAAKIERYKDDMLIIENAIAMIPAKYQATVWKNVMYREKFPEGDITSRQWSKYKYRFIYKVATDKGIILKD